MRFCNIFSIIAVANSFRMQRMGTNPKFGNRISLKTSLSMESDAIPHGGVLVNTMITSKQDIANAILYAIDTPNHVNVNEILIRPITQDR